MARDSDFQGVQRQLARHIRSQGKEAAPDHCEERRLQVYRRLFYNNVAGFLENGFPVCRSVLEPSAWQVLVDGFFEQYPHHTPLFLEISREFTEYLQSAVCPLEDYPPWLAELAHYEWLELAIDVAEADVSVIDEAETIDINGDVLDGIPVIAEACEGVLYQYPVHTIQPGHTDPLPRQTALVVFRDALGRVRFVETNPFTLALLALVVDNRDQLTGRQLVESLLQAQGLVVTEAALRGGCQVLLQWHDQGVLRGTAIRRDSEEG